MSLRMSLYRLCAALLTATLSTSAARAADWPTWRHDAMRTAVTDEQLPATLHLQWTRDLPPLQPAWPDQDRLRFDVAYEPIVAGKQLFIASPVRDRVTAYDTDTGGEKWRFYTNGPVRFAPTAWKDKLYFVSDDGHLYCVNQSDGVLVWKFRGAPTDRLVLGNRRLISMWPARGASVIVEGKVYFGAGIWPVMGVFVYALDAETGEIVWHNDALGPMWIDQPHNSPAFAGIGPQGYLAAVGDRLFIPGGRSVPACLDRKTGKLDYYRLAESGKTGEFGVLTSEKFLYNGGQLFDITTGIGGTILHPWRYRVFGERPRPVLVDSTIYDVTKDDLDERRTANASRSSSPTRAR